MEKAKDILNQLLHNLYEKEKFQDGSEYYTFVHEWEHIIGKKLFGHAKIIDLRNKSLIIAVDHPGWMQILRLKEKIILKRIQRMFPQLSIKTMKLVVKEDCFKINGIKEKSGEKVNEISKEKEKLHEVNGKIDKIGDEQLRNIMKRLYMSIVKKEDES